MLNEFDLKDWDKIDCEKIRKEITDSEWVFPPDYSKLIEFIDAVELIRKKQVKQVASLLKPKYCDDFGRCNCLKGSCDRGLKN